MSIFTKIINGELPSYKILENDKFYAFLDIFPLVEGHTLVIPKEEIDKFFDMPEDLLSEILVFAKPIAKAIEQAFDCNRCGISVVGLEVPHAHMHMVPLNTMEDLNFTRKKMSPTPEELKKTQEKILKYLNPGRQPETV
ncbi:MAG: HIT family protein [Chitinophagaceae bacterium]|nr:HIT family protein [Chitinophagaceae bacterium]